MFTSQKEILNALSRIEGVFVKGHYLLTSGRHGGEYFNKNAIYPRTRVTSELCHTLMVAVSGIKLGNSMHYVPHAIVAPTGGAVLLSQGVAHHFYHYLGRDVLALYADKIESTFVLRRGYEKMVSDKEVVVVEDVLTTGGSLVGVIEAVRRAGGHVVAAAAICNRGGVTATVLGVSHLVTLFDMKTETWLPENCPLCAEGVSLNTSIGHGK